ncbi:MAG: threonine--tRNA ligase [Patescibacteria group bacterium]
MENKSSIKYLENLRHSCAHLLAAAVMELWPKAKRTIGPAIEDGFYFDFDFGDIKISEADFPKIEKKMHDIVSSWKSFKGKEVSEKEAKEAYKDNGYKIELIEEFSKDSKKLTFYKSGNYSDLCRGGHVEKPNEELKYFRLLSVAGAYWRGNEKNKMLTRIYGTCWPTEKELISYIERIEEAKKRDHRKIGKELELFTISDEVGRGLILWLPKGVVLRDEIEKLGKEVEAKYDYQRVVTPHIGKEQLYLTSGHLPYYAQDMWPPMEYEGEKYYLKPMNCPHMHMIYKFKQRTYRDLPLRLAEFGAVYRHEDSGTLMGMMRVRGHTTNDAHLYCKEEDVIQELVNVLEIHKYYYKLFGIKDYYVELALPDFIKKKDKYFDDPEAWKTSIELLRKAAKKSGIEVIEQEGSAAFYGPKFDFNIKSSIGREFGASTNQLDFASGKRFGLTYVDKDGSEKIVPYIVHRAPLGSEERFIGFLIEHYGGAFPTWLAPVQAKILPITDRNLKYSQDLKTKLMDQMIRVEVDDRSETLQAKIRDAQMEKVPYMIVIGDKEEKTGELAVRNRAGKTEQFDLPKFIAKIKIEIDERSNL